MRVSYCLWITDCTGDTPYADHVAHQCVAECASGHEIKGGSSAESKDCQPCEVGQFADHVGHVCNLECTSGYVKNEETNNCDVQVLSRGTAHMLVCARMSTCFALAMCPSVVLLSCRIALFGADPYTRTN